MTGRREERRSTLQARASAPSPARGGPTEKTRPAGRPPKLFKGRREALRQGRNRPSVNIVPLAAGRPSLALLGDQPTALPKPNPSRQLLPTDRLTRVATTDTGVQTTIASVSTCRWKSRLPTTAERLNGTRLPLPSSASSTAVGWTRARARRRRPRPHLRAQPRPTSSRRRSSRLLRRSLVMLSLDPRRGRTRSSPRRHQRLRLTPSATSVLLEARSPSRASRAPALRLVASGSEAGRPPSTAMALVVRARGAGARLRRR